ncbi:Nucleic acid-binding proteins superfamily [Raphanus sativus]|nr:Nucleic acid-binding proteins superfamily [Raphanus sativus]
MTSLPMYKVGESRRRKSFSYCYGQVLHEPFLKFLKHEEGDESEVSQETERLAMEYYDPKPGIMMTNEKVPLYEQKFDYLLCDLKYDAEEFLVHGKMEIVKDDDEDGA